MYYSSLREARELVMSGEYRRVPVSRELLSNFITPIQALRILQARSGHCFLLESAADSADWRRYTFLGYSNLVLITTDIHRLLHATKPETIKAYMDMLKPDKKQMAKINRLRKMLDLPSI